MESKVYRELELVNVNFENVKTFNDIIRRNELEEYFFDAFLSFSQFPIDSDHYFTPYNVSLSSQLYKINNDYYDLRQILELMFSHMETISDFCYWEKCNEHFCMHNFQTYLGGIGFNPDNFLDVKISDLIDFIIGKVRGNFSNQTLRQPEQNPHLVDVEKVRNDLIDHFGLDGLDGLEDNKKGLRNWYASGKDFLTFEAFASNDKELSTQLFYLLAHFNGIPVTQSQEFNACYVDWETGLYAQDDKNPKKLTRVLNQMFEHVETIGDLLTLKNKCKEFEYIYDLTYRMQHIGNIPRAYVGGLRVMPIPVFIAWLGEHIKKAVEKITYTWTIDFRPEASLVAGNVKDFRSCFRSEVWDEDSDNGQYSTAPTAYALNAYTAILYRVTDDRITLHDRVWLYFPPEADAVYFGRIYGTRMTDSVLLRAAQMLGFNTDDYFVSHNPGSVWKIAHGYHVYTSDDLSLRVGLPDVPHRIALDAHCLACGDTTLSDASNGLCYKCNQCQFYHCIECNRVLIQDDYIYWSDNGPLCEDCAVVCDHCGEIFSPEQTNYVRIRHGRLNLCNDCLNNEYVLCDECGSCENIGNEYYIDSLDITVCRECIDHFCECDACGDTVRTDAISWDNEGGVSICFDCKRYYEVCDECNTYHHRNTIDYIETKDGWMNLCSDCRTKHRDIDLDLAV